MLIFKSPRRKKLGGSHDHDNEVHPQTMTNGTEPLVSVLVPMRNEERYIEACLRSLAGQDYPHDRFEVLVIDGASTDRSRDLAQQFTLADDFDVRILDNPAQKTAPGLNVGLEAARGEVIVRVDAHAEVAPDFLSQSIAALRETDADAVGGPIESIAEGLVGEAIALAMSSPFGVGNAAFRYSQEPQYTDTVAFAAYRRDVFERIGGFAEDIDYGEDDEFNYRLGDAGGKIFLTPAIRSVYHTRSSLPALFRQYRAYGRAKVQVLRRHPAQARLRQFVPASFVGVLGGLSLASPIVRPLRRALPLVMGLYLLAALAASLRIASRHGWRYAPVLPLALACLHVSYGLGFLESLLAQREESTPIPNPEWEESI
ncbi:MAG: glycosyltransferase family 2 protein [Dehalococcoidia bacterium]|nr:glycosyltransferase family 2 protein [Dehalococcoidia bacterium]